MAELTLHIASLATPLSVRHVSVHEALSEPFRVTVWARSPSDDLDFETIIGADASISVTSGLAFGLFGTSTSRRWAGVCERVSLLETDAGAPGESFFDAVNAVVRDTQAAPLVALLQEALATPGLTLYRLDIVPRLSLLGGRTNHRIFQHMSVPDIVAAMLDPWHVRPVWKIDRPSYPKLEMRTQFGETDLAFVSRMLEEAGITYFFEDSREPGNDSWLVLSDMPHAATARVPLPYVDKPNRAAEREFVTDVHVARQLGPGKIALRDHDLRRKADYVLLGATLPLAQASIEDHLERYSYRPGASLIEIKAGAGQTPVGDDQGTARHDDKHLARLAQQELDAHRAAVREIKLTTNALDVAAGAVLAIENHPRHDLGPEARLLIVEATHEIDAHEEWQQHARAVFAATPYRPAARTPRPSIDGVHCAVVVGPGGEEIHVDEMGRVRVQFPWDRDGKFDEHASSWVRVSEGWAGPGYGAIAVPRVGHEVLIAFVGGNPDLPVVIGRVHGALSPVPHVLPEHATRSTLRTRTSPGGEGGNELMFDDAAGREIVFLHAQRDQQQVAGNDRGAVVGKLDTVLVGDRFVAHVAKTATGIDMADGRIALSTGKASIELSGDTLRVVADGSITIKSTGGDVVLKGGPEVRINVGAGGAVAKVDRGKSAATSEGTKKKKAPKPASAPPDGKHVSIGDAARATAQSRERFAKSADARLEALATKRSGLEEKLAGAKTSQQRRDINGRIARLDSQVRGLEVAKQVSHEDLVAAAIYESNLDPNAESPTHARGMLQLTRGTARDMGRVTKLFGYTADPSSTTGIDAFLGDPDSIGANVLANRGDPQVSADAYLLNLADKARAGAAAHPTWTDQQLEDFALRFGGDGSSTYVPRVRAGAEAIKDMAGSDSILDWAEGLGDTDAATRDQIHRIITRAD